ncbi:alpha/beta hydrolase [bacterium (Candidatus Blackallbacteria) CG17_big_fil_post_rev_8_21_14_2_50_48_46]|uniref:Alpha/beta hydrolase n=1 Tax=bacterium (Candidatus Blackallbacteria) CG17_big_fil_post_rev_8_21_14_2_50_48_46 TaxID=2014261 RepID=A0A2M7G8Z7_9BACT|nr:MAG: alpha/beta hydrolase [bacterium (Candidatus Blackallbacteria) CG18_big_fil_WC_8_21_14_2_50_49_26]PIW18580.1 MAG: alpha/beta hydrolase [bacterium (Candidatus Blackallbacteria) CG17_big_fil_post_rev_8_21_14_2_50_48_46]PIW46435.1 MAG: alpha/beta hydrolase [bacterium (Candidatus Blackallbacteria) CG13_big_fil_rev_8_21_14_2_50_49_14]
MTHWFFLRGLIRESGHWLQFPRQFKQAQPESDLHFLEIPGTGHRFQEKSPTSIAGMVEALQADFLRQNSETSAKPWILSISLGAMITLEWLVRYPDQFAGAVLINTSLRGLSPVHHRLQPHNYPWILRLLLVTRDLEARERHLLRLVSNEPHHHLIAASKFAKIQHIRPISRENALRQLYAASQYQLGSKPKQTPILLLNSEGDRFVNPECTRALAKFLELPYQSHPHAGHDLPLDAPEWVIEKILDWQKSLRAS